MVVCFFVFYFSLYAAHSITVSHSSRQAENRSGSLQALHQVLLAPMELGLPPLLLCAWIIFSTIDSSLGSWFSAVGYVACVFSFLGRSTFQLGLDCTQLCVYSLG